MMEKCVSEKLDLHILMSPAGLSSFDAADAQSSCTYFALVIHVITQTFVVCAEFEARHTLFSVELVIGIISLIAWLLSLSLSLPPAFVFDFRVCVLVCVIHGSG